MLGSVLSSCWAQQAKPQPGQHCSHEWLSELIAPLERRTVRPNYKGIIEEGRAQYKKGTPHKKTIKYHCGLWEESKIHCLCSGQGRQFTMKDYYISYPYS